MTLLRIYQARYKSQEVIAWSFASRKDSDRAIITGWLKAPPEATSEGI